MFLFYLFYILIQVSLVIGSKGIVWKDRYDEEVKTLRRLKTG